MERMGFLRRNERRLDWLQRISADNEPERPESVWAPTRVPVNGGFGVFVGWKTGLPKTALAFVMRLASRLGRRLTV